MNYKKTGWMFLFIILVYVGASYVFGMISENHPVDFRVVLFLGEAFMLVPALLFLGVNKVNLIKSCRFQKVRVSTVLMTVLFAFLVMPAATFMNVISMFFVENTVAQMSTQLLKSGFFISFFAVAIYGPCVEEIVFRGGIFQGYRESASSLKAILLSALLFGMMHMNFNQMGYAFVLGIAMALLMEATGSIWPSIVFHIVVNARSVITLFLVDSMESFMQGVTGLKDGALEAAQEVTAKQLWGMLSMETLLLVICLPIAGCILVWIAKREGRWDKIKNLWAERKEGKVLSIPAILGILICIGIMVMDVL